MSAPISTPTNDAAPVALARAGDQRALAVPSVPAGSPITNLLTLAVERGTPVAELKELVALHDMMMRREAEKEFAAALAAFQAACPSIHKSSTAKITSDKASYSYKYAELDEIARTINPILAKHGLSYGWDMVVDTAGMLTVICTLRHAAGHSITSRFALPVENKSAMSPQQKVGSADTYAQRRSLSAVLGLTTTNQDTDAGQADPTTITDDQATEIDDLITEKGADRARFLKWAGVGSVADIRAVDYDRVITTLRQMKPKAGGAA